MARVTEIKGLRELGENIKRLNEDIRKKIGPAMTGKAANVVKKAAIANAPDSDAPHEIDGVRIEPGNLKRNIIVVKDRKSTLTSEHIVTVRGKEKGKFASRYGSMVEHGTVKMRPQPFLRPALDNNVEQATMAMKTIGEKRVAAALKGTK